MKEIEITKAMDVSGRRWIDVRSPGEYGTATIPGAVNVPLFEDDERARVGTVYKEQGREAALKLAMEIVSPKIPRLVERTREAAGDGTPVLFCWRGGMRSKSMAAFLDLAGIDVLRLKGGYRTYRKYVTERLQDRPLHARLIVLHGLTGTAKTDILRRLEEKGVPVLDLEGMAGHRGSAFGSLGVQPRNQRTFDSLLLEKLDRYRDEPYMFMEAESRRIGRVHMPDFLDEAKEKGIPVLVEAAEDSRVRHILDTYLRDGTEGETFHRQVTGALSRIEGRLAPDTRHRLRRLAEERAYAPLVRILLREYYDPRYRHTQDRYADRFSRRIRSDDPQEAVRALIGIWQSLTGEKPAQVRS